MQSVHEGIIDDPPLERMLEAPLISSLKDAQSGIQEIRQAVDEDGLISTKAGVTILGAIAGMVLPKSITKGAGNKVDDVIRETLSGKGNLTSKHTLNSDEALDAGLKHLGTGYKEIGKPGSGVFRSADGTKQFRIDNNSLSGNHAPNVPHVHLETYKPGARKPKTNNHIPLVD